jgi:hypothetical protein
MLDGKDTAENPYSDLSLKREMEGWRQVEGTSSTEAEGDVDG